MPSPVTPNTYEVRNDVAYVDVGTKSCPGTIAQIDAFDLHVVLDGLGRWYAYAARNRNVFGVRRAISVARGEQGHQLLPRLLVSNPDRPVVMHLDHDGLNNRRANLLATTRSGMAIHARHAKGKLRGVFQRGHRFRAIIGIGNRVRHLGSFSTETEAAIAYDAAALELFGDLARLNFPSTT